jgi:glycine/D-amino acid oxidase-like deaminating enzyme
MTQLRVAVVGGGLGGLSLAQGLLRTGADVTVYERDASLVTRRQGYRLHLDARAGLALDALLPPDSFARFQATCAQPSRRLTVTTERLRVRREQVAADRLPAASPADGGARCIYGKTPLDPAAALLSGLLGTAAADGSDVVAAIGDYERQMREYGYAAVAASRQAEAQIGARRNRLLFWLYRRLARDALSTRSGSGEAADAV